MVDYDTKLKNATKENKLYIKYSSEEGDTTTKIHTPKALKEQIENLVLEGHKEIIILYNMPFVNDKVIIDMNFKDLVGRNEKVKTETDAMKRRQELNKIDKATD